MVMVGARGFEPPTPCSQSRYVKAQYIIKSGQTFRKRWDYIGTKRKIKKKDSQEKPVTPCKIW
jgi:hypothetical protein